VGEVTVKRPPLPPLRLPCLQFPHWIDGRTFVPVQLLVGYPKERLLWLQKRITDWMADVVNTS
jgi:hypothetical protein